MTENAGLSGERIREAARASVQEGADIRQRMHDLTLAALQARRFDRAAIREVVRAVAEGATLGAEASRRDLRLALSEAFQSLDEALARSAKAGRTALRQLAQTGKSFSEQELKQALAGLETAAEFGARFALAASGVLGGIAAALREPKPAPKKEP